MVITTYVPQWVELTPASRQQLANLWATLRHNGWNLTLSELLDRVVLTAIKANANQETSKQEPHK